MITNFKFMTLLIIINIIVNLAINLTPVGYILIVLWNVLLYLSTRSSNLLIYTFFDNEE